MTVSAANFVPMMSPVANDNHSLGKICGLPKFAGGVLLAASILVSGPLLAQQGTSVSDVNGPKVIVPSTRTTQVTVLNGDSSVTGFATSNPGSYAVSCAGPIGIAVSGGASLTLALDEIENGLFQTGSGSTTPAVVGRGVPYSGTNCSSSPALAAGGTGAKAVLSTEDIYHKRLYVVSTGSTSNPDTITGYNTTGVGYFSQSAQALTQPIQSNLDTGGTYTSVVVDTNGLYGDAIVTELRTQTNAGGTWVYSYARGKATKLLGPGGVDLSAINSFIIHNPTDGGGGLLVLVNQDGLTASNLTNPPLDTTPFTIIDLGQLHELLSAKLYPPTLTLPTVKTISSSLNFYAMLGAVYNPGDRNIYAVVGGGTSLTNIQRQVVRYGVLPLDAPTETVVNDVSIIPLSSAQATQLAINGASGTLQILAKDSNRLFTASISTNGPVVTEITGPTFNDTNFVPIFITSNSLLGETYIASAAQVDVLTKPVASKMQAVLDLTGPEVQQAVGQGYVQLLGMFPDTSDLALSTAAITITATPVIGGSAFTFATVNAGQTLTLPTLVSGTFPAANIYTLVASYPGDAQYAAATSAPVTIAVGQAYFSTSITATAGFNSGTGAGSATVTLAGSTYVPGGTIALTSVSTGLTLATLYLSGGISNPMVISFTAPPTTTAIVATYSGDSKNQGSTTGNVPLKSVALVTPTITATVPVTGTVGNNVHLNVVFASTTTNAPTGSVKIFASSATSSFVIIGTVSASAAFATGGTGLNWSPLVPDSYGVYAQYGGDSHYNATTIQVGSIVISGGVYTFALSSPTTVVAGTPFNVIVNASSGLTATGVVTVNAFTLGSTTPLLLGTVSATAAANGGATLAATIPSSGVYFLNGSFAGDTNYPASSSANSPTVNVTSGTTPAVTLTPASVKLTVAVGTSFQRSFLLFNTGGVGLKISGITVAGVGFSQFNGCPTILQSGDNCTINVVFAPTASGTYTGTLSIADNATGSPHTAVLTGVALPAVSITASTGNFVDQTVGTSSINRPLINLTNITTGNVDVSSLSLNNKTDFEVVNSSCGAVLGPQALCHLSVVFHPSTPGNKTATVTVNGLSVPFAGNGLARGDCKDTDGDGLCDDWEKNGVMIHTADKSDVFIDLPTMGAKYDHKDVFVQVDYMETASGVAGEHTHKMKLESQANVIQAFDHSPVTNVDGTTGIHVHIDCGPTCIMDPVTETTWGTLSKATSLPEQSVLDPSLDGSAGTFTWTRFDQNSVNFKTTGRSVIFHHSIFAHDQKAGVTNAGVSRNGSDAAFFNGASDYVVSLGSWANSTGTAFNQARSFMHELGHNLGLAHGGRDQDNGKPNYLSIMNYNTAFVGIIIDGVNGYIDYSRQNLPSLDEFHLDERIGLNVTAVQYPATVHAPSIDHYGLVWYCQGANMSVDSPIQQNSVNGNTNWNCDKKGTISPQVAVDINLDAVGSTLAGAEDWSVLKFNGGAVSGLDTGFAPPAITPQAEFNFEQNTAVIPFYSVEVYGPGALRTAPGSSTTVRFSIANRGQRNDSYNLSAVTAGGWVIAPGLPATISIAARASAEVSVTYTVPAIAAEGNNDVLTLRVASQNAQPIVDTMEVRVFATTTPKLLAISSVQASFGSGSIGGSARQQVPVVLTNTGTSALTLTSAITSTEFSQTNNCGTSLAAGVSCVVTLSFTPAALGIRIGTLTLVSSNGTDVIQLSGTGQPTPLDRPDVAFTATPTATSTGQLVTLSAAVSGSAGLPPTGTLNFYNGGSSLGQATLDSSGKASFSSSTLPAGTYSLFAAYSGDSRFLSTNAPIQQITIVTAVITTTTLATSSSVVAPGSSVTFTATASPTSGTGKPTGSIQFFDGSILLSTSTVDASGKTTYSTSILSTGTHIISAVYAGDNVFAASTSTALTQIVALTQTTTALTTSATTVITGSSVTLSASVSAASGTPTGSVVFLDGTTTLATVVLNGAGVATYTSSTLAIGTHSFTAQYAATGNFGASTSSAMQIVVTGSPDFSVSAYPISLTVTGGSPGSAVFTVTPVNGYAGTLSLSCGTLPTHASCSFAPTKLTFTATTQAAQATTLTFSTNQTTALLRPLFPRRGPAPISLALGLPFGLLALGFGWRRGSKTRKLGNLYLMLAFAALAGVVGLSGCGSSGVAPSTPAGTYTVPVTLTDGTTSHSLSYSVTVK